MAALKMPDKVTEIVKHASLDVARFWLSTLVAIEAVLSHKATPQQRANNFGIVFKELPWTKDPRTLRPDEWQAFLWAIAKAIGTVEDAVLQVLEAQRKLWNDGKTPAVPSPGLLALSDPPTTAAAQKTADAHKQGKPVMPAVLQLEQGGGDGKAVWIVAGLLAVLAAWGLSRRRRA